jgi:hypothetical protein
MSISRMTATVTCPECGTEARFSLFSTIDAGRTPALREAILDRSLQRERCGVCGTAVRPPPAFMYFDRQCGLWIAAHAWAQRSTWQDWEERARVNFQTVYESGSSIGKQLHAGPVRARVTFGWEALREKIVVAEQDIDDVLLEIWKFRCAKAGGAAADAPDGEWRLLTVSQESVVLATIAPESEQIVEQTRLAREVFEEGMAAAATEGALRKRLEPGIFVDILRLETASPGRDGV